MELKFDLDQDELPIFMAETDEQLQVLDEGLIRLEKEGENEEFVQALFRAAHTLKGNSGMVGHKRMVTVTHALENALDGLRKRTFTISTPFIDLCLEAVDALRLLREEVLQKQESSVNVEDLAGRFAMMLASTSSEAGYSSIAGLAESGEEAEHRYDYMVEAFIAPDSVASAARALQLMMGIQELGTLVDMEPTLEVIETARPVSVFKATFLSKEPLDKIQKALSMVSELSSLSINTPESKKLQAQAMAAAQAAAAALRGEAAQAGGDAGARSAAQSSAAIQSSQPKASAEKTLRTSVERLDNLMNLVGELITDRNRLYQIRTHFEARFRSDERVDTLSETITHIGRITDQLQKEVMGIRMLPVSNVFHKFPRMVRDLANKFGKQVDLVIEGEDTELDRSVIEEIQDPLIHLLRNCVDHGIENPDERLKNGKPERGRILLDARHEQGRIVLTVEDDGKGIDGDRVKASAVSKGIISEADAAGMSREDAVNLVFASGLSTAKTVSDISGRGVGLDIVRNNIQRLNGTIQLETSPGNGTRFQITLPLTLAIVPTLLIRVGPCIFAVPLVTVSSAMRIVQKDIQTVNNYPVIMLRDQVLPILNLAEAFGLTSTVEGTEYHQVVIVSSGKQSVGLIVDGLLGQEEVVVKSLGPLVGDVFGVASAAILGDGQVILIVDVQDLFRYTSLFHSGKQSEWAQF